MFTQSALPSPSIFSSTTATATTTTTTAASSPAASAARATPPSHSRGRLRGLNYLRNYTQNHLLSRDSSGSSSAAQSQSASTAAASASLQRASTHTETISRSSGNTTSGRRRSRNSVALEDTPSSPDESIRRTVSAQPSGSSSQQVVETSSDSDKGRKKARTGAESQQAATTTTTTASTATTTAAASTTTPTQDQEISQGAEMTRTRSATTGDLSLDMLPTIRFSAHYDPRSTRQSLSFTPLSRTLPTGKEVIKVGRYSEREQQANVPANTPSAAPVGFKSKVVSRRHCEFWHENGKWYIKDVKSSSGTFLNHIRLSPPGNESKPYIVNDGDIVQLGIDFRGGEEMIFRCVKMRIELNRGWQAKPNNFNMATHKRLRNLTSSAASTSGHTQDCSICLNAIAPCQSLFVAPCSHTWHFKCIRELLNGPSYPIFTCPNCRAAADLDADIDEPDEEWQQLESGAEDNAVEQIQEDGTPSPAAADNDEDAMEVVPTEPTPNLVPSTPEQAPAGGVGDAGDVTMMLDSAPVEETPAAATPASEPAPSTPVPIPQPGRTAAANGPHTSARGTRTPSPTGGAPNPHEGPLTPRNDIGPWVFDGDAGRSSQDISRPGAMSNLDAATTQVESNAS